MRLSAPTEVAISRLDQAIARAELRIEQLLLHLERLQAWQRPLEEKRLAAEIHTLEALRTERAQLLHTRQHAPAAA